jgi:hypothetical protein
VALWVVPDAEGEAAAGQADTDRESATSESPAVMPTRRLFYRFTPVLFNMMLHELGRLEAKWRGTSQAGQAGDLSTAAGRQLHDQLVSVAGRMEPLQA